MVSDSEDVEANRLIRALRWLAESHRNLNFITEKPPEGMDQLGLGDLRFRDLVPKQEPLDYEPRSIAVSPDGRSTAIGTKSGDIHLLRWNEAENHWDHMHLGVSPSDTPRSGAKSPIRALSFIGSRLLAAGWGSGEFRLFSVSDGAPIEATTEDDPNPPPHGWFNRFTAIISLVPPDEEAGEGPIALGLTSGHHIHVLRREGGTHHSSTRTPMELGLPGDDSRAADNARLVGGGWAHDLLWLLTSQGLILRLRRSEPSPSRGSRFPFELDTSRGRMSSGCFPLTPIRGPAEYKDIRVCMAGIAVRISDEITVLRFRADAAGESPGLVAPRQWEKAGDVVDFTVGIPFFEGSEREFIDWSGQGYKKTLTKADPLWVVAATTQPGLRWISWIDRDGPEGEVELLSGSVPHPPRLESSALFVHFGWRDNGRMAFLAYGLRDHKFCIAPLVNRQKTADALAKISNRLNDESRLVSASKDSRGLSWWLLRREIGVAFGTVSAPSIGDEATSARLQKLDGGDLRSLLGVALRAWLKRSSDPDANAAGRLAALRKWILLLLTRARELEGVHLVSTLAQEAVEFLSVATVGSDAPSDTSRRAWNEVGLLAGFLRKWFVFGYTYAEKPTGIEGLYRRNLECDQKLDALHYATLLLHQRFDLVWESRPESGSSPTHWSLAVGGDGAFSIHADAHGAIHALSEQGRALDWLVSDDLAAKMHKQHLETDSRRDGVLPRLRLMSADQFIDKFQQGPYARRLLLFPLDDSTPGAASDPERPTSHVLVFCFKGRREDLSERATSQASGDWAQRAQAFAVLLRGPATAARVGGAGGCLEILDIASFEAQGDLYGLCRIKVPGAAPHTFRILAGTNGIWQMNDGPKEAPFVDIDLRIEGERIASFVDQPRFPAPEEYRSPYQRPLWAVRTTHNPCWSLCSFTEPRTGRLWVWAGFHDGQIRCYLYDDSDDGARWLGGGGTEPAQDDVGPFVRRPRQAGLQATSAVWSLHLFRDNRKTLVAVNVPEERWLLAYGTADGVIGVIELPPENRSTPFTHFVHTQESEPICGLIHFEEDDTVKLLAVAQNGMTCVFDVGCAHRTLDKKRIRFPYSGLRCDRFQISESVRAIGSVAPRRDGKTGGRTELVFGTSDGRVSKCILLAVKGSAAREQLLDRANVVIDSILSESTERASAADATPLRPIPTVRDCVGNDHKTIYSWIRIADVRDDHLMRFALSSELRVLRADLKKQFGDGRTLHDIVAHYLDTFQRLTDETFRRLPFSREPMKIIWDQGAAFANSICVAGLEGKRPPEERKHFFDSYLRVARTLEDMGERWSGYEPAIEPQVLMHVFDTIFTWNDVVIVGNQWSEEELLATHRVRRFIVRDLLQRRLSHAKPLVVIEALQTVNRALLRAIARANGEQWVFTFRRSPEDGISDAGNPDLGLFEVMAMVGSLTSRFPIGLSPSRALYTEVSRFFGLCLLLVPDSSLLIAQVVSESDLAGLSDAVVGQAESLRARLHLEFTFNDRQGWDSARDTAIQRFKAFLDPDVDGPGIPEAINKVALQNVTGSLKDDDFLREHAAVNATVTALSNLRGPPHVSWLKKDDHEIHYFKHSFKFLRWVSEQRDALHEKCRQPDAELEATAGRCRELLRDLRSDIDLYEPHRTRYRTIFDDWERNIRGHAQAAIETLNLVEGFDRHVYRPSADGLVAAATELALRTAPLFPGSAEAEMPRRELIERVLAQHPLVGEIYSRGIELAEASHLIGILIKVAGGKWDREGPATKESVPMAEVLGLLKSVSQEWPPVSPFLVDAPAANQHARRRIPGTAAIWEAILREWVKNVSKYGLVKGGSRRPLNRMCYQVDLHEGAPRLRISGELAFADGLRERYREPRGGLSEGDYLKGLVKRLGTDWDEVGLHDGSNAKGSYGLLMIRSLAGYIGVDVELALDAVRPSQAVPLVDARLPLCLSMKFTHGRGELQ